MRMSIREKIDALALDKKLAELEKERNGIINENAQLRTELKRCKEERTRFAKQVDLLKASIDAYEKRIEKLRRKSRE